MEEGIKSGSGNKMARILISALVVLVAAGILGYVMMVRSLPGDALYGVRVSWLEERNAPAEGDVHAQARFALERMEYRLEDLRQLEARGKLTPETIEVATDRVGDYVNTFVTIVYDEVEHDISAEELVSMLSEFSVLIRAQQHIIAQNPEHADAASRIENLWREVTGMRLMQIGVYVYEAPQEEQLNFITAQITKLTEAVESGELSEAELSTVNYHLSQAVNGLTRGNFADAIGAVLEAEEMLTFGGYIE